MRDIFLFHFKKLPLTLALWIFSSTQALPLAIQSKDPFKSQSIEAFQKALSGDSIIPKIPLKNIKVFTDQESLFSQFFSLFNTQIINKITNREAKMFLSFVNGPSPLEMQKFFILKDDHKTCLSYYFSIQKDGSKLSPRIGLLIMFLMEYSLNYQNLDGARFFGKPPFEKLANNFFKNIPKASFHSIRENYLKNLPTLQKQIASLHLLQKKSFLKNLKNLFLESPSKRIIVRMIVRWFRKIFFRSFYKKQANDFFSLFEEIKTNSSESSQFLKDSLNKTLEIFENFQNSPFGKALELDRVLPVKEIILFGKRTDLIHIFSKILQDKSLFVIIPKQYSEKLRGTPSSLSVFILKNIFEQVFEKRFEKSRNKFQREFCVLLSLRRALKRSDSINFESTWRVFMQNSEKIISENIDFFLWDLMKDDQYEFFWETLSLKKADFAEEIKTFEATYFTDHPEHISLQKNIEALQKVLFGDSIIPKIPLKNIKVFTDQESLFSQFFSLFNTQIINKLTNREAKMFLSFVDGPSPLAMADLFILKDDYKSCLSYYFSIQKDGSKLSPLIGLLIMFLMEYSLRHQNFDRLTFFGDPLFEKLANDFFQNIPQASLNTIRENYLKNLPTLQEKITSLPILQKRRFLNNLKNLLIASHSKRMSTRHFRKSCFDNFYKEQAEKFLSFFQKMKTSSSESSSFLRNSRDEILRNFKNFQNSPFGKALELDKVLPVKKIILFGKRTNRVKIFSKILQDKSLFIIIPKQYSEELLCTPSSLSVFILKNIFEQVFEKKFGKSRNKFQREFAVLLSLRRALKLSDPINFESTWRVFMQNSEKITSENRDSSLWELMKDDQYQFFWDTISLEKEDLAEEIKTFEATYFTNHPEHISLRENISQLQKQMEFKKNA